MWDMAVNSITLFLRGKLFQDTSQVVRQVCLGAAFTTFALVLLATLLPATGLSAGAHSIWVASAVAGCLGGMLQPYLFKDLKYA